MARLLFLLALLAPAPALAQYPGKLPAPRWQVAGVQQSPVRVVNLSTGLSGSLSSGTLTITSTGVATSRTLTAGAGLTGGGTLASDRTFDVGQGDGITVNANDVAVDGTVVRTTRTVSTTAPLGGGGALSGNLTLTCATCALTTTTLTAGAGLTGGGDLSAGRTFAVGAGDGIQVNADDVAVDATVLRTTRAVNTSAPLGGGGALSGDLTLTCATCLTTSGGSITGSLSVSSVATVGHLVGSGSAPSCAIGAGAGAGSCSVSGTDAAGVLTVVVGAGAVGDADLVTVTFATAFVAAPVVVLQPANEMAENANYAIVGASWYYDSSLTTTTLWKLYSSLTYGPPPAGTYRFSFIVVGK